MVASSARRFRLALLVALLALLVRAVPSYAKCDPTTDPDKSDIASARAEVAANCPCTGPTVTHGAYVRCAAQQANASLANPSCARAVEKCAAKSTCGKPDAVTCCVTRTGSTKCKIKRDAAHCTAPNGSTACVGPYTSCCDACTSSGCATTTTSATTTTTSSTPTRASATAQRVPSRPTAPPRACASRASAVSLPAPSAETVLPAALGATRVAVCATSVPNPSPFADHGVSLSARAGTWR